MVMNRTERSDQAIALRRRSARMRRIDGLRRMAEMLQNPLDDCGFLDAGDIGAVCYACSAGLILLSGIVGEDFDHFEAAEK